MSAAVSGVDHLAALLLDADNGDGTDPVCLSQIGMTQPGTNETFRPTFFDTQEVSPSPSAEGNGDSGDGDPRRVPDMSQRGVEELLETDPTNTTFQCIDESARASLTGGAQGGSVALVAEAALERHSLNFNEEEPELVIGRNTIDEVDHECLDDVMEFEDILDTMRHSAKSKLKSAIFHLSIFLRMYFSNQLKTACFCAKELELVAGIGGGDNSKRKSPGWFDKMISRFFSYLSKAAYKRGNKSAGKISYESATGYASSIKAYYENKFRTLSSSIPAFQASRWRRLRTSLRKAFEDESRKTGVPLTNPREMSTDQDREAIAIACIWMNDDFAGEFWHLSNSMVQYSGRGSEVSLCQYQHLRLYQQNDIGCQYNVISTFLKRQKQLGEQNLPVYPFRDGFHQDWYFSFIYQILMMSDMNDYMFPRFAKEGLKYNSDDKNDSKVSQLWRKYFDKILGDFVDTDHELVDMLNKDLQTHHGKKASNQKMAESPSCSGLAQIFRTGWVVRGFHSIFDYVVGSQKMISTAGKAVSNWHSRIGDNILGGQPPSHLDITQHKEEFDEFVQQVFAVDRDGHICLPMRRILVCSLLRHWDDFIDVLQNHPQGKFENLMNHTLYAKVTEMLANCNLTEETHLNAWISDVKKGFFDRNLPALPISKFPRHLPPGETNGFESMVIDPRAFVDHVNSLVSFANKQSGELTTALTHLAEVRMELTSIRKSYRSQEDSLSNANSMLCDIKNAIVKGNTLALETQQVSPTTPPNRKSQPPPVSPPTSVKYFSVSERSWKSNSIVDRFVSFFVDQAVLGYEREKSGNKQRNGGQMPRAVVNKYSRCKKLVRFMLMFMKEFPPSRPQVAAVSNLRNWEDSIRSMACAASELMHKSLSRETVMNPTQLCENKIAIYEWDNPSHENHKHFPPDIPSPYTNEFLPATKVPVRRTNKKRKARDIAEDPAHNPVHMVEEAVPNPVAIGQPLLSLPGDVMLMEI